MKGTFGKFMNFQEGEYGMAILSVKPLTSTKMVYLPNGNASISLSQAKALLSYIDTFS